MLRRLRAVSGLSLSEMSARTGVSPATLSRFSSGLSVPTWEIVSAFADAADMDAADRAELKGVWQEAMAKRSASVHATTAGVELLAHTLKDHQRDADRSAVLRRLYEAAGRPSVRLLAEQTQHARSTVHRAITGKSLAGAEDLVKALLSGIPQEHRPSFEAEVDLVFGSAPATPAPAPPLFKVRPGDSSRQAEQAVAEFRRALRALRNLAVHGAVELNPQLAVQVMHLDAVLEEAAMAGDAVVGPSAAPDPESATIRALQTLEAMERHESGRDRRIS
ncbi:helix-turn-helix domain-containing protein [Streptomyces murinus]|uniref:helix-turn-helix domain-containing protein n=1 Tax=Streptomyces murinus TaxID=33900 RepID=UPI003F44F1E5